MIKNSTGKFHPKYTLRNKSFHPSVTPQPFTAPQLATLYNFPSSASNGAGQTVGIIELGGGYVLSDIVTHLQNLGITHTPNIVDVLVDGAVNDPMDTSGANVEVVLDIEIVASIVPFANIRVYFAPNSGQGFYDGIQTAINDNCNVISISWGGPENMWSSNELNTYNTLFQSAVNKNITIFTAAGDQGSSDGVSGTNVDFPASSPFVIACGGTTLIANGSAISQETVWDNNPTTSATGGGSSTVFTKPSYQASVSTLSGTNYRGIPDVAGNADPNTGYLIYYSGQNIQVGGTSAVAPLWAGLLSRVIQMAGVSYTSPLQQTLYGSPTLCRDITSGNNGAYSASIGLDYCTGLGSPNGTALLNYYTSPSTVIAPVCSFNTSVSSGTSPLTVVFTDTSINTPTSWSWNFGDGYHSTLQNPTHIFQSKGTFTVTLVCSNSRGSSTHQNVVTVTSVVAPVASFTMLTLSFRDVSTNSPTSWLWNFGDNNTSMLQNPSHTYTRSGTYTVRLTATNSRGSSTISKNITLL